MKTKKPSQKYFLKGLVVDFPNRKIKNLNAEERSQPFEIASASFADYPNDDA